MCRIKAWKSKHKVDCEEILRLKSITEVSPLRKQSSAETSGVATTKLDHSYDLEPGIRYKLMCLIKDKPVFYGYPMSDTSAKSMPRVLRVDGKTRTLSNFIFDMCVAKVKKSYYIIASVISKSQHPRMEMWSYPALSFKPIAYCINPFSAYSALYYFENHLLASDFTPSKTITQYTLASKSFEPTGLSIPININSNILAVSSLCALRQNGERRIILVYSDKAGQGFPTGIKCIDFSGQSVSEIGGYQPIIVDDMQFLPEYLSIDTQGNVYVTDRVYCRVLVLNYKDCSLRTVLKIPGTVQTIKYSPETHQPYVLDANEEHTRIMVSVFNIGEYNFTEIHTCQMAGNLRRV